MQGGVRSEPCQCSVCKAIHDRKVNAAQIILAAGHRRLAEGISVPLGRRGYQGTILTHSVMHAASRVGGPVRE
jgi:hypothetical protein